MCLRACALAPRCSLETRKREHEPHAIHQHTKDHARRGLWPIHMHMDMCMCMCMWHAHMHMHMHIKLHTASHMHM